jgi:hypothetical protein
MYGKCPGCEGFMVANRLEPAGYPSFGKVKCEHCGEYSSFKLVNTGKNVFSLERIPQTRGTPILAPVIDICKKLREIENKE